MGAYILLLQDDCDNVTRFLILAREPIIPGTDRPFKVNPANFFSVELLNAFIPPFLCKISFSFFNRMVIECIDEYSFLTRGRPWSPF